MSNKDILNHLERNMKLVLGPDGTGKGIYYCCMQFNPTNKILRFNTDVDYKMNGKTEEVMKILCEKFDIKEYQIEIVHVGELGLDLDIFLDLNKFEKEKIAEVIGFIKYNFYDSSTWIYKKCK